MSLRKCDGIIAAIQTFGNRINFHPHFHILVTESGVDEAGILHKEIPIHKFQAVFNSVRPEAGFS
jgi:hypothetical protein